MGGPLGRGRLLLQEVPIRIAPGTPETRDGRIASGIVGLHGFLRILQPHTFEAFDHEVRRIVQNAHGRADDPDAPRDPEARRTYLLDRLDDLKSEAVRPFAEGGQKGEGLLSGIVAPVDDTRNSLAAADRAAGPGASSSDAKIPAGRIGQ